MLKIFQVNKLDRIFFGDTENKKEYATIYTMMVHMAPSPFRIKANRIFNGSNFTLNKHLG